nr:hypothetical protein G6P99_36740 [Bradyrhizobium sp. 6(2017)]
MASFSDETPISAIELPSRMRNALIKAGLVTAGHVRKASDTKLRSLPNIGPTFFSQIRKVFNRARTR